jgi:hypothetical protein
MCYLTHELIFLNTYSFGIIYPLGIKVMPLEVIHPLYILILNSNTNMAAVEVSENGAIKAWNCVW